MKWILVFKQKKQNNHFSVLVCTILILHELSRAAGNIAYKQHDSTPTYHDHTHVLSAPADPSLLISCETEYLDGAACCREDADLRRLWTNVSLFFVPQEETTSGPDRCPEDRAGKELHGKDKTGSYTRKQRTNFKYEEGEWSERRGTCDLQGKKIQSEGGQHW